MNKLLIFPKDPLAKAEETIKKQIEKNRGEIDRLCASKEKTYKGFVRPYMECADRLHIFFTPISHVNAVINSPASQEAFGKCLPLISEYESDVGQDNRVYEAYREILEREKDTLTFAQKKVLEDGIFDFELTGVNLPKEKKERLKGINVELSKLSEKFSQNVLDATKAYKMKVTEEKTLGNMPESDRAEAKTGDGWEFTLQMPSYTAFMTYSPDREKREEMYKAYCTRAPENGKLIERILALRHEKAGILGFKNFADLNLKSMSAPSADAALSFLWDLADKGKPYALSDVERMKVLALDDGVMELQSHDVPYYTELIKKQDYDYDEEALRPYFETERVVKGLFELLGQLFGLSFVRVDAQLWHEEAEYYQLFYTDDEGVRKFVGSLFLDLYTRPEKRGGAWMDTWRSFHYDDIEALQRPEAFLICNFPRGSETSKSLLRHSDVATLFHEMGHGLHHLLSKVEEVALSGVNGIDWDTVEFPSQFLENFAYVPEVLDIIGAHTETGEKIPADLAAKIMIARNFHSGMLLVRQAEFALFDMLIHQGGALSEDAVQRVLDEVRERVAALIPKDYNKFQHGFLHIFSGGYAAGYYSYKWAEMLAADAFLEFKNSDLLNRGLAERYRDTVLSLGASKKMGEIYRDFLGRDPNPEALLKLAGIE